MSFDFVSWLVVSKALTASCRDFRSASGGVRRHAWPFAAARRSCRCGSPHRHMRVQRQLERLGYLLLITLGAIVLAFMGLSLAITATGTARFAVAMGYSAQVGYAVGASSTSPRRCYLSPYCYS